MKTHLKLHTNYDYVEYGHTERDIEDAIEDYFASKCIQYEGQELQVFNYYPNLKLCKGE